MAWFADLAGKAEHLLNNLDEKTGAALKNNTLIKTQRNDIMYAETPSWMQKPTKRPFTRNQNRKQPNILESKSTYSPPRKQSATVRPSQKDNVKFVEYRKEPQLKTPPRKGLRRNSPGYDHVPPHTMVGDTFLRIDDNDEIIVQECAPKSRRNSLPNSKDLRGIMLRGNKQDSLEAENEMLKTEVNVMNQEVSVLLDRLKNIEDVLIQTEVNVKALEKLNGNLKAEKESLVSELEVLKEKQNLAEISSPDISKLSAAYQVLEGDFAKISQRNKELQDQIKEIELNKSTSSAIQMKIENELRFAHMTINGLQSDLEKSRSDNNRMQSDWDAYKLRVKSMLAAKDQEIEAMQRGPDFAEGTKVLTEQLRILREDREELASAVTRLRSECADTKSYVEQLESRAHTSERLVAAMREALREERQARNKSEGEFSVLNKEFKNLQMDSSHTIANLKSMLRDKENQLHKYQLATNQSLTSVSPVSDTSALNVADYDRMHESISSEKIQLLTQSLIVKQGRIDALLADNNTLKIQMEKIEAKYRAELRRCNQRVIQVNDGDAVVKARVTGRNYVAVSAISKVSLQIGVFMRRHPLFRLFIILYMVGLHLWVLVVLLTYTPEIH